MKKAIILSLVVAELLSAALVCPPADAQRSKKNKEAVEPAVEFSLPSQETREQKLERMKWWTDARFGMFIHWGLYSMPARHEWVKNFERLTNEDYQKYFDHFNPDLFEPKEWAAMAKQAGMKYVVLTSKHHEGFCMWDSQFTDYKCTNTPAGRDLIREFVDAFRAEGLKVGFYYSLLDWHHPDYTIDRCHPQRIDNGTKADYDALNQGRNMDVYRQYMKDQVTELLTRYGKIDIIWFDFSFPGENGKGHTDWDSEGLLKLARTLQPDIIVDDRLDLKDVWGGWDIFTPEQEKLAGCPIWNGEKVTWETCQTFSGSWGYHRDEATWKSIPQLLELLIETVSKEGNLLLNVGPTSRGEFDYRAQDRLKGIGKWMHQNSRSIYGCTAAPADFEAPERTLLTYNPEARRLYIHLIDYPLARLSVSFTDRIEYAQFLHDGSEIRFDEKYIYTPVQKPDTEVPVIEVFLK
ncbi:MAG: alpha-L-fucosidase [Bacteroidales bacterium]|nr:alpha-L-fucosidase [Bacteroidales bacterium]